MIPAYSQKEISKILETLPPELKEALFSNETAEKIESTAEKTGADATVLAKIVGLLLIGLLHPDDLQKTIQKELDITEEQSKRTDLEVRRFILSPVRESISKMYEFDFLPIARPVQTEESRQGTQPTRPTETSGQDTYREPIEG